MTKDAFEQDIQRLPIESSEEREERERRSQEWVEILNRVLKLLIKWWEAEFPAETCDEKAEPGILICV